MRLLKITEADLGFARTLRNDVRHCFFSTDEVTREQQQQWYQNLTARNDVDFWIVFIADQRIGTISITHRHDGRFEIGNVVIDHRHQGKGYAAQAARMQLAPGRCYIAHVRPENTASRELFRKLGFVARTELEWELLPLTKER